VDCECSRSPPGQIPRTGPVLVSAAGSRLLRTKSQDLAGKDACPAAIRAVKETVASFRCLNADDDYSERCDRNYADE